MILPGEKVHGERQPRTSSRLHPSAATHTVRNASSGTRHLECGYRPSHRVKTDNAGQRHAYKQPSNT